MMTLKHSNHKQKTIAVENHFDPVFFSGLPTAQKIAQIWPLYWFKQARLIHLVIQEKVNKILKNQIVLTKIDNFFLKI